MNKLSKFAYYAMIQLQTLTDNELEYTISTLSPYIDISKANLSSALDMLVSQGYITKSQGRLKLLKKIPYPRFMTLNLDDKYRKNLALINSHLDGITDLEHPTKVAAVIDLTSQTVSTMYRNMRANGVEINMSLFDAVDYECQGLTTVIPAKEEVKKEPVVQDSPCVSVADYAELVKVVQGLAKEIEELKETNKRILAQLVNSIVYDNGVKQLQ